MSRLLARIMLALLMLPMAGLVYILMAVSVAEGLGIRSEEATFFYGGVAAGVFVMVYWVLLWRRTVRWTRSRLQLSALSIVVAIGIGTGMGFATSGVDHSFGIFIGCIAATLLWLMLTVFVWRETRAERQTRLRSRGATTIVCPVCGYNMTGLGQASCPECGATFTVDELLAAQPARADAELDEPAG